MDSELDSELDRAVRGLMDEAHWEAEERRKNRLRPLLWVSAVIFTGIFIWMAILTPGDGSAPAWVIIAGVSSAVLAAPCFGFAAALGPVSRSAWVTHEELVQKHVDTIDRLTRPMLAESERIAEEFRAYSDRQDQAVKRALIDAVMQSLPPAQRPSTFHDVSPWGGGDKETP